MSTPGSEGGIAVPPAGRLAAVLAAGNDVVGPGHDGRALVNGMCTIAVGLGGMEVAGVWLIRSGSAEAERDPLELVAQAGADGDFLDAMRVRVRAPGQNKPGVIAMREGRPVVRQDLAADPETAAWAALAAAAGVHSGAVFPLYSEHELIGMFAVFAAARGRFDDATVEEFQELAAAASGVFPPADRLAELQPVLRSRQDELETLFSAMNDAVVVLDHDLRIVDLNPAFARLKGADRARLLGTVPPWPGWTAVDDAAFEVIRRALDTGVSQGRVRMPRSDGVHFTADVTVTRIEGPDGEPRLVSAIHDVTELEAARDEATSTRDYLEAVTTAMVEGLYATDADGRITYINAAAAAMLGWTVEELIGVRAHDTFHETRPDGRPYSIEECPVIGCTPPETRKEGVRDTFLRRDGSRLRAVVSAAPFSANGSAGGTVVAFSDGQALWEEEQRHEHELSQVAWVGRVREALDDDRLLLYAQPIVDAASGDVVQHELLLRMRGPTGTILAASDFLPSAERFGLMGRIDRWVVLEAVALAARGIPVEFNLSAGSFADASVLVELENAVHGAAIDPALIVVEVTETALINAESATRRALERIQRLGCRVAIDDFGTGFGGLTYVKRFPVDILKIDVEFVTDALHSEQSRSVVHSVVELAGGLGLSTVAEGVEDAATFALMQTLGVSHIQGFHVGRPTPAADLP